MYGSIAPSPIYPPNNQLRSSTLGALVAPTYGPAPTYQSGLATPIYASRVPSNPVQVPVQVSRAIPAQAPAPIVVNQPPVYSTPAPPATQYYYQQPMYLPPPPHKKKFYCTPWFWGIIGFLALLGLTLGLIFGLRGKNANLANPLKSIGDGLGSVASGVGNAVGTVANGVGGAVGDVAKGVGSGVGTVANGVGDAVGTVAKGVGSGVGTLANGVGSGVGTVANGVGDAVGAVGTAAKNLVTHHDGGRMVRWELQ